MKTNASIQANYHSSDCYTELIANLINNHQDNSQKTLKTACLDTPLGSMIAVADDHKLYSLQFTDYPRLARDIEKLKRRQHARLIHEKTALIVAIEKELDAYFSGQLKSFNTPLDIEGSDFQKSVWDALLKIPYGEIRSYSEQAESLGKPTAYRAVANANGVNQFVIVIPCHRIINHNGNLGGYGGGLDRKAWLLDHERNFSHKNSL